MSEKLYTCPCCGFMVFSEAPGSYEICVNCGWEDDAVQLANPCSAGGANSESLEETQYNFKTMPDADINESLKEGYVRDLSWRPVNMIEKQIFLNEIRENTSPWVNRALSNIEDAYWNRNIVLEKTYQDISSNE